MIGSITTDSSRDNSSEDTGHVGADLAGPGSGIAIVDDWRGAAFEGVAEMGAGMTVG